MPIGNVSRLSNDSASFTCQDYVERWVEGPNSDEVVYT